MISGAFFRGTTPTHTFTLPFEVDLISDLRITYSQNKNEILTKSRDEVKFYENDILVTLTQQETLLFTDKTPVFIQIKIKLKSGQVVSSEIITMRVDPSLNEEVI